MKQLVMNAFPVFFKQFGCIMFLILLLLLVLANSPVYATGIDGFMNIPWGTSRGDIAKQMAELSYPKDPDSNQERDIYDGMFAGHKAYLSFFFINNLFYKGNVYFIETYHAPREGDYSGTVDAYFREFEPQLIDKYGTPSHYNNPNDVDYWEIEDQGTNISIVLSKSYADSSTGAYSGVTICYTNETFYTAQKQISKNQDL